MRLRSKTILALAALLAIMAVVLVTIVSDVVTTNALKEERNAISADLGRAITHVSSHNADLGQNVKDWAVWDDSYAMVQGLNPDYIRVNLPNATMVNLKLNLVLFYNSSLALVDKVGYDYLNDEPIYVTNETLDKISSLISSMRSNGQMNWDGLLLIGGDILYIACHEVKDTLDSLPAMGAMIMARFVNWPTMVEISNELMVTTTILPADDPAHSDLDPSDWADIVLGGVVKYRTDGATVSASKSLPGIDGRTAAILKVQAPRDIYERATASIVLVSIVMLIVVFLFLVVSLAITDLFTLRRIGLLSQQVTEIGREGKSGNRVHMDGSDELTDLAAEVNRTLDAIGLAEQRLMESEKRYRAIVNDQSELIFRMRPDGTITFANDALLRELHLEGMDILGQNSYSILPMFPGDTLASQAEDAVASEGSVIKDYRYNRFDEGKEKWYSLSLRAISSENEVEEFQGVVRDLTEKMQAEMALVEANKKLSLLASISRQSVMSQLIVAQGFVSIALAEDKGPRTVEHLKKAEAALKAIQGHLEFTRDYQRTGMVIPVWINLGESLEKAAPDIRAKGLQVNISVSDFEILADPLAERIFYNLMENSFEHGKGAKRLWVRAQLEDRGLVLTFEDDGKGIAAEDKERIFEVGSGTSYGLFLAREILSSAGVTITENGTEGQGACFEVVFPSGRFRHAPK